MLRCFVEKDFYYPFVIWLVIILWYFVVGDKLLSTPQVKLNNSIAAQSFWLFNEPPEQASNITIVVIDQASRRRLNLKWPWKRSVTAELIGNIASFSPRVIGLDIVFSGESEEEEDRRLASALGSHPRIVLGYVWNRASPERPNQRFAEAASSMGFVNKWLEEGVVSSSRTYFVDDQEQLEFPMDILILQEYFGLNQQDIKVNEKGVFLGNKTFIPSPKGRTPINYLVYHNNFTIVPAHMVLEKRVNPRDFRDKIVLVGATDPLIHDQFPTFLGTFPGVTILGNSLTMLLSERFLHNVPLGQGLLFAICLGCLVILINKKLDFLPSSVLSFFLLVLVYFSFVYLRAKDIVFPHFFVLFSGMTAYVAFNVQKYASLIYVTNRLKNQAIIDSLTGLYSPRFFLLKFEEKVKASIDLDFVGLRVGNYRKLSMELSFEQLRLLVRRLGTYLAAEVDNTFGKAHVSCLSPDTFGIFLEGEKRENVGSFLEGFLEKSKHVESELGDKGIGNSLRACLVHKNKDDLCKKSDVIRQMENLFKKAEEGEMIIAEKLEQAKGAQGRKVNHRDMLDFITYDWEERNKDLEKSLKELLETNKRLDKLNWGTLTALARAIDAKSPWTAGHSERVTELALKIGRVMGLSQGELKNLHRAGLLHDIGKIATPLNILDKPGSLTAEERRIICEHPKQGMRILEPIEDYAEVVHVAMQHHEWFDGNGYPDHLAGEEITLGGRILAVTDVFDALTSERPYRTGMPLDRAIQIIKEGIGTQFDPRVVEAFLEVVGDEQQHSRAEPQSYRSANETQELHQPG